MNVLNYKAKSSRYAVVSEEIKMVNIYGNVYLECGVIEEEQLAERAVKCRAQPHVGRDVQKREVGGVVAEHPMDRVQLEKQLPAAAMAIEEKRGESRRQTSRKSGTRTRTQTCSSQRQGRRRVVTISR